MLRRVRGVVALITGAASLLALAAVLAAPAGCQRPREPDGVETVVVWQPFFTDLSEPLRKIVDRFEQTHPRIRVRLSYAPNNLTSNQKLFLATAGGKAPDVTFVDGQQLAEWAARGALTDVTGRVNAAGLSEKDFFEPRWRESTFGGRVYALPWCADPNFAMLWNKGMFRAAGLDPDHAPRTMEELDAAAERLTVIDASGRVQRIGFIPWEWGGDNSLFTWGYAFGGDFYRMPAPGTGTLAGQVTADDPRVVQALTWMNSYARKYDIHRIAAFQSSFVGFSNNPFFTGKVGITLCYISQIRLLKKYAPGMDYGIAPLPAPPGGEYPTGWLGGWSLAIPRGVKPRDATFEFMRWMCASPEGTDAAGRLAGQFPAFKASPYFATISQDRDLRVFYDIALHARHVRTLMPVQGYLMQLMRRGVDEVLYGNAPPAQVLGGVTQAAQRRLEQVLRP